MLRAPSAGRATTAGRRTAYLRETEPRACRSRPRGGAKHNAVSGICIARTLRAQNWNNRQGLIEIGITSLRFAVVGAGRLGASFALALRDLGARLVAFSADTPKGRDRAEGWLGGTAASSLQDVVATHPDLYLLAVPDRALPAVAADLAQLLAARHVEAAAPGFDPSRPLVVAHTSGATSVEVLAGCLKAGTSTLAFHPLQTFSDPATGRARFAGAAVALTPGDASPDSVAARMGFELARALGAKPFLLPDDKRTLYHAAASVACNYLVTLQHEAKRLFVAAGLPEDHALQLFLPLVRATLDNVAQQGTVKALTGPLSRGDLHTIEGHLSALRSDAPDLVPLYRSLGLATLDLVRARNDVPAETIAQLAALLNESSQPRRSGA
jgi:predicted short-subunit dehydrogenase-like oxidoreductase (DUF2520 family)